MRDVLARVRALMARALDDGASLEEQRTAAHVAVGLIWAHHLLVKENSPPPLPVEKAVVEEAAPRKGSRYPGRVVKARSAGHCQACGRIHHVGDTVAWYLGEGPFCVACLKLKREELWRE